MDAAGRETQDPACLFTQPRGALLPAGGHRGFALGLAVEVLAGILSGTGFSHPNPAPEKGNGLFILALDVAWWLPLDQFRDKLDQLTAHVKSARPVPGGGPVYIPGERSREGAARRTREGIPLDDQTWARVVGVLEDLGLSGR
jgi:LDH2 family malate/lactate/ureidoglycolate dehydrogenase